MHNKINIKKVLSLFKSLISLLILVIILSVLSPVFLTANNLFTVTLQISIYCILAMGALFVMLVAGADLSAGSTVGLVGILFVLMLGKGIPLFPAILISLLLGALVGLINGFMVTKMHIIPFVATFGMQYIVRGLTQIFSNGQSVAIRSMAPPEIAEAVVAFNNNRIFDIVPVPSLLIVVFAVLLSLLLSKTVFGRRVYAVGSNAEAARLSGINSHGITILCYIICGLMSSVAGLLLIARVATAQPTAGVGYEFEGIAAAVIGGVSMLGGVGTISGAVIGSIILGVMRNGLNLLGVNAFWQNIITGLVIIGAVYLDILNRQKDEGRRGA